MYVPVGKSGRPADDFPAGEESSTDASSAEARRIEGDGGMNPRKARYLGIDDGSQAES